MTSDEARLFEEMNFSRKKTVGGFISPHIVSYFFGNNPYNRTGRECLMVCDMALSELDNDMLATFIGALSISAGGRGTFLGYKCATENIQKSLDAALEGRRERCKIVITPEAHNALWKEWEERDEF